MTFLPPEAHLDPCVQALPDQFLLVCCLTFFPPYMYRAYIIPPREKHHSPTLLCFSQENVLTEVESGLKSGGGEWSTEVSNFQPGPEKYSDRGVVE